MAEIARVAHAAFELPASAELCRVTNCAFELPAPTELCRVTQCYFELPTPLELCRVTQCYFELPQGRQPNVIPYAGKKVYPQKKPRRPHRDEDVLLFMLN